MTIKLLTLDEVADALKVSRRTVNRLVKSGQLRPIRVGNAPRVTERDLDAYIASLESRRRR